MGSWKIRWTFFKLSRWIIFRHFLWKSPEIREFRPITLSLLLHNTVCLVGNVSSLISATCQSAVLNKINNHGSLASLWKEDYPNAGQKLFGVGFEKRLKARAETATTLMDASSAGRGCSLNHFLYRGTSHPFWGSPYHGRGANRAFRNHKTGHFHSRGQHTNFRGRGQQWTSQAPAV